MISRSAPLLIILALAACASGSEDAGSTTAGTAVSVITPAPDPPDTTTTTTTTSTTPPTPTTTQAPTTTLEPITQIEAAVKQAYLDLDAAYLAAAGDPANRELREAYRAAYAPDSFEGQASFLDELLTNGTRLRINPDVPRSVSFPSPIDPLSASEIAIEICEVDSDVIYMPATDTQPEVIIDDRVVTRLARSVFVQRAERWVLESGELLDRWEGHEDSCGL